MMIGAHVAKAGRTILIVDDIPANIGVLLEYLEENGFRVVVAQDGEEGLMRAQFVKPDLILLDVMMPGINGFETCRRIKAIQEIKHIPVIFMTALTDAADKLLGFEVGGVDYVTKPIALAEVLARINTHLALCSMQEQLWLQNQRLEQEVKVRQGAEAALQHAQAELEERVRRRTSELAVANKQLKAEIAERTSTEKALAEAKTRLEIGLAEMERLNREITLVGELSSMLQACPTPQEAYATLANYCPRLFPGDVGVLYARDGGTLALEVAVQWGGAVLPDSVLLPGECWGLRQGRPYCIERAGSALACAHVKAMPTQQGPTLCVPIMAQGGTLGLLYLEMRGGHADTLRKQGLAVAMVEQTGLALANIRLREALRGL